MRPLNAIPSDPLQELTSPRLIKSHLPYRFLPSDLHNGDSKVTLLPPLPGGAPNKQRLSRRAQVPVLSSQRPRRAMTR